MHSDKKSSRPRRRKNRALRTFKYTFISLLMVFAAVLGIFSAVRYTRPYNIESAKYFDEDTFEEVEISEEKCNILIMGTDKEGLRTDVIMLAQINPLDDKVTVMSIPRDTWVNYRGSNMKITEVHAIGYNRAGSGASKTEKSAKGSEATIIAVRELTGVPINYHIKVNFAAFRMAVDELGGVDFDVPQRMVYSDPYQDLYIDLAPGMQHLDGDKAEQLVRFRQYINGDLDRIKVQQDFLHELVAQKLKAKYIGKVGDIYSIIVENMETLMSPNNFVQCGQQVLGIGGENIKTVTLPVSFVEGKPYVKPKTGEISALIEEEFGYDSEGNDI